MEKEEATLAGIRMADDTNLDSIISRKPKRKRQENSETLNISNFPPHFIALKKDFDKDRGEYSTEKMSIELTLQQSSNLTANQKDEILDLVKINMLDLYDVNWGWNEAQKSEELFDQNACYLLGRHKDESSVISMVHFRVVDENEEEDEQQLPEISELDSTEPPSWVLYIYEIQVAEGVKRQGVGSRMMACLEELAMEMGLNKMVLTVFKNNTSAMRFYCEKLGFQIDDNSPSKCGYNDECYEILSKHIHTTRSKISKQSAI